MSVRVGLGGWVVGEVGDGLSLGPGGWLVGCDDGLEVGTDVAGALVGATVGAVVASAVGSGVTGVRRLSEVRPGVDATVGSTICPVVSTAVGRGVGTAVMEGNGKVVSPIGVRAVCGAATGAATSAPAAPGSGISEPPILGPPSRLLTSRSR